MYNDTHGHRSGDEILRILANLLLESSAENYLVGRWGGEEFVVMAPDTDLMDAQSSTESIRAKIETSDFRNIGGEALGRITISAGVAILCQGESPSELVARADGALYEAKRGGRNQVQVSQAL